MNVDEFAEKVGLFHAASASSKTQLVVYFLTEIKGAEVATRPEIENAFRDLDEAIPPSLASHLSGGLTSRPKRYVRRGPGYRLERNCKNRLEKQFNLGAKLRESSAKPASDPHLEGLQKLITGSSEQRFLAEAITCYSNRAYRAAIVMSWLLAMDHLFQAIIDRHLVAFNDHLSADPDKRLNVLTVTTADDLSSIKESKIIELAYKARIISKDLKRIWDERLGLRNSAAHPSNVDIGPAKAAAFIEDVVQNMILKLT